MKKTIGILGGMGPLATCDLFRKILDAAQAEKDQAFPRVVVDSNTEIPDRTAAILHHGEDPLPEMIKSAVRLQSMGADVLVLPCNTAHYYYEELERYVDIPILNMIRETAVYLKKRGICRAGLLATDGTIQSGVYKKVFDEFGIVTLLPQEKEQKAVMEMIYDGVKSGNFELDPSGFCRAMESLMEQGAQMLVLGCTELPIAFSNYGFSFPAADPTDILAKGALRYIGCLVKEKEYNEVKK